MLAKYQPAGSPLLSGYLLGEEHLQGYASALDVNHGDGHVILLGMRMSRKERGGGGRGAELLTIPHLSRCQGNALWHGLLAVPYKIT